MQKGKHWHWVLSGSQEDLGTTQTVASACPHVLDEQSGRDVEEAWRVWGHLTDWTCMSMSEHLRSLEPGRKTGTELDWLARSPSYGSMVHWICIPEAS